MMPISSVKRWRRGQLGIIINRYLKKRDLTWWSYVLVWLWGHRLWVKALHQEKSWKCSWWENCLDNLATKSLLSMFAKWLWPMFRPSKSRRLVIAALFLSTIRCGSEIWHRPFMTSSASRATQSKLVSLDTVLSLASLVSANNFKELRTLGICK